MLYTIFDKQNETLNQYHTRLRTLAKTCAFPDVEFEIEQQIITAGTSTRIRKKALRDPTYDLKAILLDGRRTEQSSYQARDMESQDQRPTGIQKVNTTSQTCRNCGGTYPHEQQCPAQGKTCHKCGKANPILLKFVVAEQRSLTIVHETNDNAHHK